MAISITINGTTTLDETQGLQSLPASPTLAEDNNDNDVLLSTMQLSASSFYGRLFNGAGSGGLGLSTAFPAAHGVAQSASNFISLSGGGTVNALGFVGSEGKPLPVYGGATLGVLSELDAVNGGDIRLYQDSSLGSRMVIGVDAAGDIAFALFMQPNATLTQASVWMVQFEALSNPNTNSHDEPMDLADSLGVAASASNEFDFSALPSGQNLFGIVGDAASGLVVIGKNPALTADGTFTNASNTINTSQGGGPTTIGVNNQMFDPGEGAYFTFVKNPDANFTSLALDANEADDADNIQFGQRLEVDGGFVKIAQIQGNSPASLKIEAFNGDNTVDGRAFASTASTGGLGTGTTVVITQIIVKNASDAIVQTINSPSANADGSYTVAGLGAGFRVEWTTSGVHDQVLIEGVSGKFDIGGFGVNEPAAARVNIGDKLIFEDDGPSISASATQPTLVVDETDYAANDTQSFVPVFTPAFGADGAAAAASVSYALGINAGATGIIDTASGQAVVLSLESGVVIGRAGAGGPEVFRVSVAANGNVTLDQSRAVVHNDPLDPDEPGSSAVTLAADNLVTLTATATDKDGDSRSATADIGRNLQFEDDGPSIGPISDGIVDFVANSSVTKTLSGLVRADANSVPYTLVADYTTSAVVNGVVLQAVLSNNDTQISYWGDTNGDGTFGNTGDTEYYRMVLGDQPGAGNYTFTVLVSPPPALLEFDFTDLPSGQNLVGIIASDKADLSKGGILVMPSNPDINADGTMTNTSGTVNTSKGGGPVTIGNGNQAFDSSGEGAWFVYVDNPDERAVGGRGLTQTSADDADTIKFDGTLEITSASVEIVQASGAGTAKRPGPALQVKAYDIDPQTVGAAGDPNVDTGSRNLLTAPTETGHQANIIGAKIYNENGILIEYRTNLENGVSNTGILQDSDDQGTTVTEADNSSVTIQFVLNNSGGADAGEDIYSIEVSNLKANYTVEWITEGVHDAAVVQHVSGSYDIGGFNLLQAQPTPDQFLEFTAQVTDGDGDTALDSWSIGIDGTGSFDDGAVDMTPPPPAELMVEMNYWLVDSLNRNYSDYLIA
jgi:hypothetical protein